MNNEPAQLIIPENFRGVIFDFTNDLSITFPEYSHLWKTWNDSQCSEDDLTNLFKHMMTVLPERFFDVLYQNEDIFKPTSETNTEFFPGVDFKLLFNCDGISENIRQTMWKYFQLLLFTVINSVQNKSIFGETMNLFEGIDETELQGKLHETMSGIGNFFSNMGEKMGQETNADSTTETGDGHDNIGEDFAKHAEEMFENIPESFKTSFNFENMNKGMPNPDEMHEHLKGMFDGKIGKIAKEMAEEISSDINGMFGDDAEIKTTQDVFKKLLKNPKKMMDLVKFVGNKLNSKMQSGELSQEDIMKEAGDIIGKMKDMGGGDEMKDFLKNMAKNMGGIGKNAKMNTSAMNTMIKKESMKERLRSKMEQKKQNSLPTTMPTFDGVIEQKDSNNFIFKMDSEKQEKSSIRPSHVPDANLDELINEIESSNNAAAQNADKKKKKKKSKK